MRTDRQTEGHTDTTKLIVAYRNVANAHKTPIRNDCTNVGCSLTLGPIRLPYIYY